MTLTPLSIIVGILVVIFASVLWSYVHDRIEARCEDFRKATDRLADRDRIAALPKINTSLMLKVPKDFAEKYWGSFSKRAGTFATRYCHILVFDRDGNVWMGLFNKPLLESLRGAEYKQATYDLPLYGPGEAYMRAPFIVDGTSHRVYPMFVLDESRQRAYHDLHQHFEKEFPHGEQYKVFHQIMKDRKATAA